MKEFLKENSEYSTMRLVVILIVVVTLIIALIQVWKTKEHTFDYVAVGSLIALALGSKVVQKYKEIK